MTDNVTTTVLEDGPRNYKIHITNESDGTGESAVTKVDISTLTGPDPTNPSIAPTSLSLKEIQGNVEGMNYVTLLNDASTDDELAVILPGSTYRSFDPPRPDAKSTGYTGDIKLTTDGAVDGGGYDLILWFIKKK